MLSHIRVSGFLHTLAALATCYIPLLSKKPEQYPLCLASNLAKCVILSTMAPLRLAARCRSCLSPIVSLCTYDVQATIIYDRQTLLNIQASVVEFYSRDAGQRFFHRSLFSQPPEDVWARPPGYHRSERARRRSKRAGASVKLRNPVHCRSAPAYSSRPDDAGPGRPCCSIPRRSIETRYAFLRPTVPDTDMVTGPLHPAGLCVKRGRVVFQNLRLLACEPLSDYIDISVKMALINTRSISKKH